MAKKYFMQYPSGNIISTSNPEYHPEAIQLKQTEGASLYKAQYINDVKTWIKPGQTIYGNVKHVSSSGMTRNISFYYVNDDKRICNLDHAMHVICGYREAKRGGVVLNGCGMDMIFTAVYDLGRCLWPDGTPEPHGSRNGVPDTDGGYALKHAQL